MTAAKPIPAALLAWDTAVWAWRHALTHDYPSPSALLLALRRAEAAADVAASFSLAHPGVVANGGAR